MPFIVHSFVVLGSDRSPGPFAVVDYEDPVGEILREVEKIRKKKKEELKRLEVVLYWIQKRILS